MHADTLSCTRGSQAWPTDTVVQHSSHPDEDELVQGREQELAGVEALGQARDVPWQQLHLQSNVCSIRRNIPGEASRNTSHPRTN